MQQPSLLIWKAFVDENLCVGCGKCTEVCWAGAIRIVDKKPFFQKESFTKETLSSTHNKKAVINVDRCICCTICMRTCPRGAIRMIPYSFQTLQREETEDLDEIKAQLKGIGAQLEEMERSIGKL
jgi:ferredoxin